MAIDSVNIEKKSFFKSFLFGLLPFLLLYFQIFNAYSQNPDRLILESIVSLPSQRTTVYQALNQISDSIGFHFAYDSRLVDSDRRIRPRVNSMRLIDALDHILGDSTLEFKVFDKHILIQPKPNLLTNSRADSTSTSQNFLRLKGRVVDLQTRKALPYVTVGIPELSLGSITNQDGIFLLKIPADIASTSLSVSHVGYKTRRVPIKLLTSDLVDIFLETDFISIQEVIIRNVEPRQLITEAISRIPENFSRTPVYHTSFYREGVEKNGKYQNYSEAIFRIYKSHYGNGYETDQVKMLKSRKVQNLEPADTLSIKLKGGVSSSLVLDIAKNFPSFLDTEYWEFYDFSRKDIVTIGDRIAYVIAFNQKENVNEPLLVGVIYIDIEDLAFLGADFEVNQRNINRITDQYVYKKNWRFRFKPVSINYTVRYAKYENAYHLSHVRGDLKFRYRYRRSFLSSTFHLFFELATTQINSQDVVRFSRQELEPIRNVFFDNAYEFDQKFWENLNIIPPERNVFDALNEINLKIEEIHHQQ